MAIYSFQCEIVARAKEHLNNAVAHSAYINRIDDKNERDNTHWRFAKESADIAFKAVMLPQGADPKFLDPSILWNAVEQKENRSNSRLARSFKIALPNELTLEQNKVLVESFIKQNFTNAGMIANYAIHKDKEHNIHCHIMTTTRELDPSGKEFAKKNVLGRSWNNKENIEIWRLDWQNKANETLKKYNHDSRIDRRTLEAQLLDAVADFEKDQSAENYKKVIELDRVPQRRVSRSNVEKEKIKREKYKEEKADSVKKEYTSFKKILETKNPIVISEDKSKVRRERLKNKNNKNNEDIASARSSISQKIKKGDHNLKTHIYHLSFKERLSSRVEYIKHKMKANKEKKENEKAVKKGEYWKAQSFKDIQKLGNTDHLAIKEYKTYSEYLKDTIVNKLFKKMNIPAKNRNNYDVSLTKDNKLVVKPKKKKDFKTP